jgi:multiple sugar transport system ATP-binding protein
MATISLEQVRKTYPNGFEAVRGVDLSVTEGEFMVLVGPSGCGKTTLLRMVAGLEEISAGVLRIGDNVVNDVPPQDRDIAMVFQNYALYPHMTVAQNIGFALKVRKEPRPEIRRRVEEVATLMGLTDLLQQKPGQLSGGQRQRVAMGRALVREPVAFLMDEPLSNLDARLRVQMRAELRRLQRHLGVATLYVTHDQTEAMTMGDRVAVLRAGTVRQCDVPQQLYDRPADLFVAGFIGSPAMNLYQATLGPGAATLHLGSQTIDLPDSLARARPALVKHSGSSVVVGIRPEHLRIAGETDDPGLFGDVDLVEPLGSELLVHFSIDATAVTSDTGDSGEQAALGSGGLGTAKISAPATAAPRPGERVRLILSPDQIHFFERERELTIWD